MGRMGGFFLSVWPRDRVAFVYERDHILMYEDKFTTQTLDYLRILSYVLMYDPGQVSLEHLLLSWYPSQ